MTGTARSRNRVERLERSAMSRQHDRDASTYEIRLAGVLDARWAVRFDGLALHHGVDGTTVLSGPIADQAALHGVLQQIRDLAIPLVSVTRIEPTFDTETDERITP
jgi:hypothetical protein